MPAVNIDGQRIYYETLGGGPPLLLMHGWTQVGRDLIGLAEGLAIQYQVILPDLPGFGQSVPPFRTYPVDFYQRDGKAMVGFLDALDLRDVHVMGFSDGGETALLLPIFRPERCRTVIAWGAVGAFKQAQCDHSRSRLPPDWITDAIRAKHPGQDVDRWPYQWVDAFCGLIAAGGDVSLSHAREIRCPLLLLLGDGDKLNPVASGERFIAAATYPGCPPRTLEVFKHAGHFLHEEQPERFLAVVRSFLSKHL